MSRRSQRLSVIALLQLQSKEQPAFTSCQMKLIHAKKNGEKSTTPAFVLYVFFAMIHQFTVVRNGHKAFSRNEMVFGSCTCKKNAVPSWSMVLYLIFLFIAKTVQLLILIWKRNFIHVNKKKNKKKIYASI